MSTWSLLEQSATHCLPTYHRECPACPDGVSAPLAWPPDHWCGHRIAGRYSLSERFAQGGMAVLFTTTASSFADGRRLPALVKIAAAQPGRDAPAQSPAGLGLAAEARILQTLSGTAGVPCHLASGYDRAHQVQYLVEQRFVDAVSLDAYLKRRGPLPVPLALELTLDLLAICTQIHARGVVHLDVKPRNVLVQGPDEAGRPHLAVVDFGVARWLAGPRHRLDEQRGVGGSPQYLAPEQVVPELPLDARADLYAIVGTLHTLLTGRAPFAAQGGHLDYYKSQPDTYQVPVLPEASPAIQEILQRGLAWHPDDRYASATELRQALRRAARRVASGPRRSWGTRFLVAGVATGVASAALASGALRLWSGPPGGESRPSPLVAVSPAAPPAASHPHRSARSSVTPVPLPVSPPVPPPALASVPNLVPSPVSPPVPPLPLASVPNLVPSPVSTPVPLLDLGADSVSRLRELSPARPPAPRRRAPASASPRTSDPVGRGELYCPFTGLPLDEVPR